MTLNNEIVHIKAAQAPMKLTAIEIIGCVLLGLMMALFWIPLIILTCCLL